MEKLSSRAIINIYISNYMVNLSIKCIIICRKQPRQILDKSQPGSAGKRRDKKISWSFIQTAIYRFIDG